MDQSDYMTIKGILENQTAPVNTSISHIYSEQCSRFDYIVFLLTPMIVFSIVFRIVYGWKRGKSLSRFQPAKFFKGHYIRVFLKKNIRFVSTTVSTLLSLVMCQLFSLLLFYFVCPWREFQYQNTLQRVFTI